MKHTVVRVATLSVLISALSACGMYTSSDRSSDFRTHYQMVNADNVKRHAVAKGVYELVYSPSLNAIFVASSGGWGDQADTPKILQINPTTLDIELEIPLQRKAFGLALDDQAQRLYVGNTVDTSLTVVDIPTQREVGIIQLEEKTKGPDGKLRYARDLRQLVVDPANRRVYVGAHGTEAGSVMYVINTDTLQIEKKIEGLGKAKAPGIWLDASGNRLFVSNLLGEILTIDTRSLEIAQRFKTDIEQPMNMVLDPATNRLFVTDQGSASLTGYLSKVVPDFVSNGKGNRVVVLDADTGKEQASFATGEGPLQIALDAQRKRLYVTNRAAGTVSVHHSNTYALLDEISLPTHPNTMARDPRQNLLFVTVKNGDNDPKDAKEGVAKIPF